MSNNLTVQILRESICSVVSVWPTDDVQIHWNIGQKDALVLVPKAYSLTEPRYIQANAIHVEQEL